MKTKKITRSSPRLGLVNELGVRGVTKKKPDCCYKKLKKAYFNIIKILLFNNCQPKTIGFRVPTSNLGHHHGRHLEA